MTDRGDADHNGGNRPPIQPRLRVRNHEEAAGDFTDDFIGWLEFILDEYGIRGLALVIRLLQIHANDNENNENPANNENNENHGNNENHDNNENHYNADDLDNDNVDIDNIDNHDVDNDDNNDDAVASAEVAVGVSQDVEEHDLLPGRSMQRSREEDEQDDEERGRKRFSWWDEDDCSSDIDTASICSDHNNTDKNTGNMAVEHAGASAEVAEEDPLPGPSRKRSREHDEDEDKASSSKKLRQYYEFADSDSDTDTDTTGHNLAQSSCDIDLTEDESAVEETDKEDSQQVEEEGPQPGRKRSRKRDDREKGRGGKRQRR